MPNIELKELAIHVVLRQFRGTHLTPRLSEALTPLDRASSRFLESKFIQAFDEANDIVRMDDPSSAVPDIIHRFHLGEIDLLETSQMIAQRLQAVQSGSTPDGMLLVAKAVQDRNTVLVIAKMEHERGARAEPKKDAHGKSVYQIEVLDDLFLTAKTRVFKVAMFDEQCGHISTFRGRLTDSQAAGRELADYFLHEFLGCERARRSEVITQSFFKTVSRATRNLEPQERAHIHVAAVTALSSNSTQVRVRDFAAEHVPRDARDDFMTAMEVAGVPNVFTKNTVLIHSDLNSIQVDFENGSILYSLPDQIGDTVVIGKDRTSVLSRPATVGTAKKKLSQVDRFPDVQA